MTKPEASSGAISEKGGEIVRLLRVLGNEDRLRIVCRLSSSKTGELNATKLLVRNGQKQSALSQHLAKMRDCRLLAVRRDGHYKFYHLNESETLSQILTAISDYLSLR